MTPRVEMTDHELLRAYLYDRDVDSLDAFVRRYQESLVRFAAKFLGDSDAAQDVVQEAFLRVARHPRRLLKVDSCHNWLLRVVRNVGVDHIRRASRQRKYTEAAAETVTEAQLSRQERPDAAVEREELEDRVRDEIEQLNPRQRELFHLQVAEGKSYREIAEITGLSVTNVGYHLHRIMRTLATRLRDHREELP
ncbi:MAG: RNA polymerase sigma factor [Planctomycetota bacterium]